MTWLAENWKSDLFTSIITKQGWVQGTLAEAWGMFNLNVYQNEKHSAFTLGFLIFVALYILESRMDEKRTDPKAKLAIGSSIFLGILVGILPYWHLAVSVVCIIFMALFTLIEFKKRIYFTEMAIATLVAVSLATPQFFLLISDKTILLDYPKLHFGYDAGSLMPLPFFKFYFKVLGIKLILIALAFVFISWKKRVDFLILLVPFVIANIVQLSKTLYVNNKLITMTLLFTNCLAAFSIVSIYKSLKRFNSPVPRVLALTIPVTLIFAVTFGGVLDLFSIKNQYMTTIRDVNSPVVQWVKTNTPTDSVFLTYYKIPYVDSPISSVTLAGRKLYVTLDMTTDTFDTAPRIDVTQRIYSFNESAKDIIELISREKIDYIVVDDEVRNSGDFQFNYEGFKKHLKLVYNKEDVQIYSIH